jgi:hypothetical protein
MRKSNLLPKILKLPSFFFVFISLFIIYYSLFLQSVLAADQCTKSGSDFHSLRPFPQDICGPEPTSISYLCGNTLVVKESFSVLPTDTSSCTTNVDNKTKTCTFNVTRSLTLNVDTTNSELPIAGLTENGVVNSKEQPSPELDDAEKINNYVSWYLNGTLNRAEGEFLSIESAEDINKLVNYSGPLNKLLPWEIQAQKRIETIQAAGDSRHDQIVACTAGVNILGYTVFGIPVPCYHQNILTSAVTTKHKLSEWKSHLPPLPDDPKYQGKDFHIYWKDYLNWRGQTCTPDFTIPVINKKVYLCFDNPLNPNFWSNLFSYVPLALTKDTATKDTEGDLSLQTPINQSGSDIQVTDIKISQVKLNGQPVPVPVTPLYFAHLQETPELASLLQTTYMSKGTSEGNVSDINPPEFQSGCKILEVRSNAGDKLYGKEMTSTLSYQASFNCNFPAVGTPSACLKTTAVAVPIQVKAPNIDNLWTKTVSGTAAIFRRIFPKLGSGGLGTLIDMPALAQVQYSASSNNVSPENAEFYIPHLGAVSEYFLKGIQTILRPKGFGESISFKALAAEGQCQPGKQDIGAAINKAATKYKVPAKLLEAILKIESPEYLSNPDSYVCKENNDGAAGIMQITRSTYQLVACQKERIENDLLKCEGEEGKLSRCNIEDAFELAARALLWNANLWSRETCSPLGIFPDNKQDIYNVSCKYYGSFSPDAITTHTAEQYGIPDPQLRNYCDIICFLMGNCPPFP